MGVLTRNDFERAVFYPAARSDIQAILRFSHITDTFVCPTVEAGLDEETLRTSINRKLETLNAWAPGSLELIESRAFTLDDLDAGPFHLPPGALTASEEADYRRTIQPFARAPLWGMEYVFLRRVGRTIRRVRWLAFTGVGLASYVALSHRGAHPPQILCTIQSGVMEEPEGVMPRLFKALNSGPRIWARGSWTERQPARGPYSELVQSFGYWCSRLGDAAERAVENPYGHNLSYVKAFTRPETDLRLRNPVRLSCPNGLRSVNVVKADLQPEEAATFDAVFVGERVARAWDGHAALNPNHVHSWESAAVAAPPGAVMPPLTLEGAMNFLELTCTEKGYRRVAMTLVGFEDEGQILREWVETKGTQLEVEVRFVYEYDLADLR